ncbi:PREDICTED: probable WRKY transcription factor 4 isoform X1 [Lupinus angustifolius]|uniref:probable WRKY transcription factor 4 isoform X1 n=1 Tax=Lupinus angustifolius TaxID=3871 RepID=UPI00092F776D|nr:PREDICTED: probable WRKY transcription factor 4 isoform X1 [Lupinus angustifolius]
MSTPNADSATAPPRPTITLPPRPSAEAFFAAGGVSPGPMTLVSNFFSDSVYSDTDCRSFSQLLAGAMASPLAFGAARPLIFPTTDNSGEDDGGTHKSLGFKQSRPMNLVVARSPMFTIPPGLSPSGFLNSPGFFSPHSPFGMSHQQALAQVTAQAVLAQSHMHMQADYHPSAAINASTEPSVEQPSFSLNEASEQQVLPSVSEPMNAQPGTSELTQTDKKYQPSSLAIDKPADDGYNWRKYGQKHVKGSEYPRSYYKCTHLNCPVKKKVERAPDGRITEIIYKGQHNHEKPQGNRRVKDNSDSNLNGSVQPNTNPNSQGWVGSSTKFEESMPDCSVPEHDLTSNPGASRQLPGSTVSEEAGDVENRDVGDDKEPNLKRKNTELVVSEAPLSQKTVTESKIIVQTRSEVDLLDDGYRWRKYGQKVVKGNPHPRSYYKCTSAGCTVRKHVERASTDPKAVVTTYEGKHNHDVPAARNSSHNTTSSNSMALKPHNVVPEKHPLLKDMDFGSNDQKPVHLRLKEEQIIV